MVNIFGYRLIKKSRLVKACCKNIKNSRNNFFPGEKEFREF